MEKYQQINVVHEFVVYCYLADFIEKDFDNARCNVFCIEEIEFVEFYGDLNEGEETPEQVNYLRRLAYKVEDAARVGKTSSNFHPEFYFSNYEKEYGPA